MEQLEPIGEPAREVLEAVSEDLTWAVVPEREAARVVPAGTLDLATVPALDAVLGELREDGWRRVVVDLRRVGFMDSTGLRALLRHADAFRRDGRTFELIEGSASVQRIFQLTRTEPMFAFVRPRRRSAALRALTRARR